MSVARPNLDWDPNFKPFESMRGWPGYRESHTNLPGGLAIHLKEHPNRPSFLDVIGRKGLEISQRFSVHLQLSAEGSLVGVKAPMMDDDIALRLFVPSEDPNRRYIFDYAADQEGSGRVARLTQSLLLTGRRDQGEASNPLDSRGLRQQIASGMLAPGIRIHEEIDLERTVRAYVEGSFTNEMGERVPVSGQTFAREPLLAPTSVLEAQSVTQPEKDKNLLEPVKELLEPVYGVLAKIDGVQQVGDFEVNHDRKNGYFNFRGKDIGRSATVNYAYGFDQGQFTLFDHDQLQMVMPDSVLEMLSASRGNHAVGYSFTWDRQGDLTYLGLDFRDHRTVSYSPRPSEGSKKIWKRGVSSNPVPGWALEKLPYTLEAQQQYLPVLGESPAYPMPIPWKNVESIGAYAAPTPERIFRRAGLEEFAAALASQR